MEPPAVSKLRRPGTVLARVLLVVARVGIKTLLVEPDLRPEPLPEPDEPEPLEPLEPVEPEVEDGCWLWAANTCWRVGDAPSAESPR